MINLDRSEPLAGLARTANGRSPKLLIVDDERAMTKIIHAAAVELGFITRQVNDARVATEAFIDFRPDLLVLDLIMPGKDGIDVLNEVLVVDPNVGVVLISGHGEAGLRLAQSVARYHRETSIFALRKPFRIDALRDVLRQAALTIVH